MGDAADMAYDMDMDMEMDMANDFNDEMRWLLDQTDDNLREGAAKSRKPKIMSIRKWPHALTDKQKWCLALWIMQRNEDY